MRSIIFLEVNGVKEVLDQITQIALQGIQGDSNSQTLARYIRQGLDVLRTTNTPFDQKIEVVFQEDNGDPRTFNLTKPLTSRPPLLEFRVNRSTPGAFRGIFFEFNYKGQDLLVFPKSQLKQRGVTPTAAFQAKVEESYEIYLDFCENPEKYLDIERNEDDE